MNKKKQRLMVAAVCVVGLSLRARAQEKPKGSSDPVAATVNDEKVYRSEVLRTFVTALKGQHESLDKQTRAKILSRIVDEMIDQRLVFQHLKQAGKAVDPKTVVAEIKTIGKGLVKRKQTWDEFLKKKGYTQTTFRRQIEWRLSWKAYLEATITDGLLAEYFDSKRSEYDGGQVRASHILLRFEGPASGAAAQKLIARAQDIRKEITSGKVTFAAAAKTHSFGPSRLKGGDIGYFPRRGVQGEAFSRAAFGLKKNEISEPVVSPLGVHLIQTTDTRPGKKTWKDVKSHLKMDVTRKLFEKIAGKQRVGAKIEYTGVIEHIKN